MIDKEFKKQDDGRVQFYIGSINAYYSQADLLAYFITKGSLMNHDLDLKFRKCTGKRRYSGKSAKCESEKALEEEKKINKITDAKVFVSSPGRNFVTLKIHTD